MRKDKFLLISFSFFCHNILYISIHLRIYLSFACLCYVLRTVFFSSFLRFLYDLVYGLKPRIFDLKKINISNLSTNCFIVVIWKKESNRKKLSEDWKL